MQKQVYRYKCGDCWYVFTRSNCIDSHNCDLHREQKIGIDYTKCQVRKKSQSKQVLGKQMKYYQNMSNIAPGIYTKKIKDSGPAILCASCLQIHWNKEITPCQRVNVMLEFQVDAEYVNLDQFLKDFRAVSCFKSAGMQNNIPTFSLILAGFTLFQQGFYQKAIKKYSLVFTRLEEHMFTLWYQFVKLMTKFLMAKAFIMNESTTEQGEILFNELENFYWHPIGKFFSQLIRVQRLLLAYFRKTLTYQHLYFQLKKCWDGPGQYEQTMLITSALLAKVCLKLDLKDDAKGWIQKYDILATQIGVSEQHYYSCYKNSVKIQLQPEQGLALAAANQKGQVLQILRFKRQILQTLFQECSHVYNITVIDQQIDQLIAEYQQFGKYHSSYGLVLVLKGQVTMEKKDQASIFFQSALQIFDEIGSPSNHKQLAKDGLLRAATIFKPLKINPYFCENFCQNQGFFTFDQPAPCEKYDKQQPIICDFAQEGNTDSYIFNYFQNNQSSRKVSTDYPSGLQEDQSYFTQAPHFISQNSIFQRQITGHQDNNLDEDTQFSQVYEDSCQNWLSLLDNSNMY